MNKFKQTFWFYAQDSFTGRGLAILGLVFAVTFGILFAIDHFGGAYSEIAIVQESNTFLIPQEVIESLPERNFHFVSSEVEARRLFDDGEVSEVFIIHGEVRPELTAIVSDIMADNEVQFFLIQLLTELHLAQTVKNYEVPVAAATELMTPIAFHLDATNLDDFLLVALLDNLIPALVMMPVLIVGQYIAYSVNGEKASRVMEVMLGKVHPTITMSAKVMARFTSMMLFFLMIILGVIAAELVGVLNFGEVMAFLSGLISWEVIMLAILVIVAAFFVYIFLFVAAGAVATSIESLNKIVTPITLLPALPMFFPMFLDMDSLVMDVLVYFPPISPFIIVQRYVHGYSGMFEVILSIILMVIFASGTLVISARIYKNGISHTSEKITLKDWKVLLQK